MDNTRRSRSYPERLSEIKQREFITQQQEFIINTEVLNKFRQKDHERAEELASLGSPTSRVFITPPTCGNQCCNLLIRWGNFMLERGEEEAKEDEQIRKKSYAGFYYFIKWFIRSMFLMIFTTIGSIAGKEIGCLLRDHESCEITAIDLANNSPHLVSTLFGFVTGLLIGQWFGRLLWDHVTRNILKCLRRIEKYADESKMFLFVLSIIIYIIGIISFGTIFFFFVNIGNTDDNIVGGIVGGIIGLLCAIFAFQKNHSCRSGERTPMIHIENSNVDDPPKLNI